MGEAQSADIHTAVVLVEEGLAVETAMKMKRRHIVPLA